MASRFKQRGILAALGGFLGGAGGAALAGSALSGLMARSNQEDAQDYNSAQYAKRYQVQMADMEAAGLNPMLTYLQSPSSSPSSPMAGVPDFGSTFNQARMADAAGVSSSASAQTAASYENMANETVQKTKQEVSNLKSVNAQVLQITDNLRQEYQNLVKQGLNLTEVGNQLRKTIDKMDSEIKLINQQSITEYWRVALVRAQSAEALSSSDRQMNMAKLLGFDVASAENLDGAGSTLRQLQPIIDIIRTIVGRR